MALEPVTYTAPPTVSKFIQCRDKVSFIKGPIGCVDADTEYLSPQGWRRIAEYDGGEVAQFLFTSTRRYDVRGKAKFVTPTAYIKLPCEEMYRLKTKYGCDQKLSAEHRVVYVSRKGALRELLAEEVAAKHWTSASGFEGQFLTTFAAPERAGLPLTDAQLRVVVAVVADGYFDPRNDPANPKCYINIKKPRKQARLATLLDAAEIPYSIHKSAPGYQRFYFDSPWRAKEFDVRFWDADQKQLHIIADEVPHWDSHTTARGGVQFSSLSKVSADFVQYVFATCGIRSSLTTTVREDKGFTEYTVMTTTSTNMVSVNGMSAHGVRRENIQFEPTDDGFKYCFSVPSSYLILRRNGCVFITGNSGKSVGCCIKIMRIAMSQAPGTDGVRRTRFTVVRNTRDQLKDTTLKTWLEWFPNGSVGRWKETDRTYYVAFVPPDGIPVMSEVMFRALDDPDDVAKVLSMEVTAFWFNECREIAREIIEAALGRVGRYPAPKNRPSDVLPEHWPTWTGVFGDTNAPMMDSYWYNVFEHLPADDYDPDSVLVCTTFSQPPGDSPEAENVKNLPTGYYNREGRSAEWYRTMVQVQYGRSLHGIPVYDESFKEGHLSSAPLKLHPHIPVIVGLDTARTPAAVFMQRDPVTGQILKQREAVAFGMGAKMFIKTRMRPIIRQFYPTCPIVIVADPSFIRRNETDDNSWYKVLKDEFPAADGHHVRAASTNDSVERINALDTALSDWPRGVPLVTYDPSMKWCREGLRSKYRYLRLRGAANKERTQTSPDKNNWSHVVEADQYGTMFINSKHYHEEDYVKPVFNPFARQAGGAAPHYHQL